MNSPSNLSSYEYLEHLQGFRDTALVESHWSGRRYTIGPFSFGTVDAYWQTEEGGYAHLIDTGLRLGNTALSRYLPTTLRIIDSQGEVGHQLITFCMDIDDYGIINIYRNLITNGSLADTVRLQTHRRVERKHGLAEPTEEESTLLYTEMQRGASGLYSLDPGDGSEA